MTDSLVAAVAEKDSERNAAGGMDPRALVGSRSR